MTALILAGMAMADLLVHDAGLDAAASSAWDAVKKEFPKATQEQVGIALGKIDRQKGTVSFGSFQGKQPFYPASTVKLFYLGYGATLLEAGKLKMTDELRRGFHDMIVDSTNDATGYILDVVTSTTGGPELPEKDLKAWLEKRNVVNRWLKSVGIEGINVNQKTWNEGPYGRERQGYGPNWENRNSLTPESGVRMMSLIALQKLAGKEWTDWMKGLLNRKIPADSTEADYQSKAFVGASLPSGSQLWSKAGYTSTARLDIAWFKLPSGEEWIYSIFTKGLGQEEKLIPFVAKHLLSQNR
jgi:hypothetical protein